MVSCEVLCFALMRLCGEERPAVWRACSANDALGSKRWWGARAEPWRAGVAHLTPQHLSQQKWLKCFILKNSNFYFGVPRKYGGCFQRGRWFPSLSAPPGPQSHEVARSVKETLKWVRSLLPFHTEPCCLLMCLAPNCRMGVHKHIFATCRNKMCLFLDIFFPNDVFPSLWLLWSWEW